MIQIHTRPLPGVRKIEVNLLEHGPAPFIRIFTQISRAWRVLGYKKAVKTFFGLISFHRLLQLTKCTTGLLEGIRSVSQVRIAGSEQPGQYS
jgi:hypothetical protein